jgi:hypothetical protein
MTINDYEKIKVIEKINYSSKPFKAQSRLATKESIQGIGHAETNRKFGYSLLQQRHR